MGFEQSTNSSRNTGTLESGGAESGAVLALGEQTGKASLAAWLKACPDGLPAAIKAGIDAMVRAV